MKFYANTNHKRKRSKNGKKQNEKKEVMQEAEKEEVKQEDEEVKCDHAFVILGIDTTNDDPELYFCWVKSTYGVRWGSNGISRV